MRLVLADDHNLFREALCYYLRQSFVAIDIVEARSLDEGLQAVEDGKPDALLLDFVMPGMDGVNGIVRAKQRCPGIPIVILSGNISPEDAHDAVRRGAAGVISKDLTGEALISALRRILAGEKFITSSAWMGAATDAEAETTDDQAWQTFGLTPREIEVLHLLVRGMADKEMARELGIAAITVRLHLHNTFRKMGAHNRVDAVRIALRPTPKP
jgi:two-component system, NarL family, nitrate/nitrite response regulator NarL